MNGPQRLTAGASPEHSLASVPASRVHRGVIALVVGTGALLLTTLAGCSGMSPRGADTAIGAGTGAVAGSILTGGSAVGTVGGAVVGGVIGDSVGKK